MSTSTSGSLNPAYVSSSKLYFNPNTGNLNATNFNSLSDIRYKTNILKIENALDKIKNLTGYTFTLIESGERSTGLIAQELQMILPESVKTTKDQKLSISYGNVLGLIIEAIKDLAQEIEDLKRSK